MHPPGETRKHREEITMQALAYAVRRQMALHQFRQTDVARWSGVSRSFVQSILRADCSNWLFLFLELSHGLKADPTELLRDVLNRRDALRRPTMHT